MAEQKAKYTRRTVEDKIASIDAKIAALEAQKEKLLRPAKMKRIFDLTADMSPEEIAKKLGVEI